jgi:hypothetical protein
MFLWLRVEDGIETPAKRLRGLETSADGSPASDAELRLRCERGAAPRAVRGTDGRDDGRTGGGGGGRAHGSGTYGGAIPKNAGGTGGPWPNAAFTSGFRMYTSRRAVGNVPIGNVKTRSTIKRMTAAVQAHLRRRWSPAITTNVRAPRKKYTPVHTGNGKFVRRKMTPNRIWKTPRITVSTTIPFNTAGRSGGRIVSAREGRRIP